MGRSKYKAETSPPPIKQRLAKSQRQGRKHAIARPTTKFTIQYRRKGKRTKPLRFDLSSFTQARKVARIAGQFAAAAVHSFTITSEDGRTETWLYREVGGGKNGDELRHDRRSCRCNQGRNSRHNAIVV